MEGEGLSTSGGCGAQELRAFGFLVGEVFGCKP